MGSTPDPESLYESEKGGRAVVTVAPSPGAVNASVGGVTSWIVKLRVACAGLPPKSWIIAVSVTGPPPSD